MKMHSVADQKNNPHTVSSGEKQ